jgi:hypothetical protein
LISRSCQRRTMWRDEEDEALTTDIAVGLVGVIVFSTVHAWKSGIHIMCL